MSTIAAISTAPGNSGIGIVRLSGEESFKIIEKIFKAKKNSEVKGYSIKYGNILDENNNIIDEVLVSYFKSPKSYSGENMCEINSHGNNIILKKILEVCLKNGAELAQPGEFTKRAFLNGRIDLLQAESVIDIINSKSEIERKSAINQLEGFLSKDIKKIKSEIFKILTNIEVSIDYPEYDIDEDSNNEILEKSNKIVNILDELEKSFERGKVLKDGIKVAIVGKPNAGKSSLLNRILREERAIVTDIEGTTRDTIEEFVNINDIPFKIIDTAGIREADNEIEKIGIHKSIKALNDADLVIAIFDKTKKLTNDDINILNNIKNKNAIILLNKIDLEAENIEIDVLKSINKPILNVSIKDNIGIDKLYNEMSKIYDYNDVVVDNSAIITNLRHKEFIRLAKDNIKEAIKTLKDGVTLDITAIYYKESINNLNKITGEDVTEDLINDIFSKFCLGK